MFKAIRSFLGSPVSGITAREAHEKVSAKEAVLVDVRQKEEWSAGKIPGAKHLPLDRLRDQQHRLPKDREVILVCRSGTRSAFGAEMLSKEGYEASSLEGGVGAWVREGLPFEGRVA